jgi:hypothetical protein
MMSEVWAMAGIRSLHKLLLDTAVKLWFKNTANVFGTYFVWSASAWGKQPKNIWNCKSSVPKERHGSFKIYTFMTSIHPRK